MSFFAFRLSKLKVVKTRELGPAEVKILSFITTDDGALPDLDELSKTDDPAQRKTLAQAAVQSVLSGKVLTEIQHVENGQIFTFGDTGYALYTASAIPQSLNWSFMVLASSKDLKFWEDQLQTVLNDPKFDSFALSLATALKVAVNPALTAGLTIAKFILDKTMEFLAQNNEKQLGILYQTFDRYEHYPTGERKAVKETDLTGNLLIDYSIFGIEDSAKPAAVS
jgi:hypothetical protein